VAISDCTVPFRVDHGFQPLDLTNLERPRSCTDSVLSDSFCDARLRSNGARERGESIPHSG
jgi:hypothetical protein